MDFTFNETQEEVQKLAAKILSDLSTTERLNEIDKQACRFDKELWGQLAEAGLLGVAIDEQYGGMGFGFTELCLLIEEVGRTVAAVPVVPCLASAALAIQEFGNETQKALLSQVASGELLLTAALSENLAEDPSKPNTKAVKNADGYVLSGVKIAVPFANLAEKVLLTAQADDGVVLLLVDTKAQGVSLTAEVSTTHEPWFELVLDEVQVQALDILAQGAEGSIAAAWVYQRTLAAYCAMQVGVTDFSLKTTAKYTCEREQFGVAIGSFQAVQHRAADCFIDIQCLRLTTYQAVSRLDAQLDASNEVLIAKIWAGDTGHRVSYAAQHLHGGMGIDKDYHLWRYCLWARQIEMLLGSSAALLAVLGQRIKQGLAFAE